MSTAGADLYAFAFGEHLDGLSQRSLGFRLLTPVEPVPWDQEVETLARHLQAAPYPDHWPATDLFCSVLLSTGQRLVAVARYGLVDHTPNQRRGGLELIGVVGPANLDALTAQAIYHWLKARRAATEDLRSLGGAHTLAQVASATPPPPPPSDPTPVLPVRLWRDGALLFAATTPSDPDHRLNLLEQGAGGPWQWLPLVGADFPVPAYAQRGPLVAWTPHLAGVALKLDSKAPDAAPSRRGGRSPVGCLAVLLLLVLLGLTGANLALLLSVRGQVATAAPGPETKDPASTLPTSKQAPAPPAAGAEDQSREAFARALYHLLEEHGARRELHQGQAELRARYKRLAQENRDLQLQSSNTEGEAAVAAIDVLSQRSADRVEEVVRKALTNKGFHPALVKTACDLVHEELSAEPKNGP